MRRFTPSVFLKTVEYDDMLVRPLREAEVDTSRPVWIVGAGPSLDDIDVAAIPTLTLALNSAIFLPLQNPWWIARDRRAVAWAKSYLTRRRVAVAVGSFGMKLMFEELVREHVNTFILDDQRLVTWGETQIVGALWVAIVLGFKDIILAGNDLQLTGGKRYADKIVPQSGRHLGRDRENFRTTRRYLKETIWPVRIFNVGSTLKGIFKCVSFEQALEMSGGGMAHKVKRKSGAVKRQAYVVWPKTRLMSRMRYIGEALVSIFADFDFDAVLIPQNALPDQVSSGDIIISPHGVPRRPGALMLFYCFEPFRLCGDIGELRKRKGKRRLSGWSEKLHRWCQARNRWFDAVLCYDLPTLTTFTRQGIPGYLVPMGYHESFEVSGSPRPEGVYLIGSSSPFRDNMLAACGGHYATNGHRNDYQVTPGVHLAIQAGHRAFDSLRIISLLLANGRCVLSDSKPEWSPLVPEVHYFTASPRYFPHVCRDLMRNRELRETVGRQGYEYVKNHLRLDVCLREALTAMGVSL